MQSGYFKRTGVVLLGILAVLFFIELGLRLAGLIYLRQLYRDRYGDFSAPAAATVIMTLGESSTAGLWLEHNVSYPAQLEEKLQQQYPEQAIRVIVPPHVGHNTSHIAHRINQHIAAYHPDVIILMVGYNNEWAFTESNITRFIDYHSLDGIIVQASVWLNELRIFKVGRYVFLKFILNEQSDHVQNLAATSSLWGGPEYARFPATGAVYRYALGHPQQFVALWEYDVGLIIDAAQAADIPVVLMTYHINPSYLPIEAFERMADREGVYLVRNDQTFLPLFRDGHFHEYIFDRDNWHPTAKGYGVIATNAFNAIINNGLINL